MTAAAADGPLLLTVTVKVMLVPTVGVALEAVLVTARSAEATGTGVLVAVLLPGVGSLVVEVADPAVYDAHNPMKAAIPGARVSAWSMGHRLDVHNLMYDKIEAFCDRDCDHRDCCEECPLQAAKQAWGAS